MQADAIKPNVFIFSSLISAFAKDDLVKNPDKAVSSFTQQRAQDSRALVTLSRNMDRPGKLGTMRFVLPLILDSMFNKVAPKLFAPSMFGMFQKEGVGFKQIQNRKRLDRVMQSVVILSALSVLGVGLKYTAQLAVKVFGVRTAILSLAASLGAVGLTSKVKMATSES